MKNYTRHLFECLPKFLVPQNGDISSSKLVVIDIIISTELSKIFD